MPKLTTRQCSWTILPKMATRVRSWANMPKLATRRRSHTITHQYVQISRLGPSWTILPKSATSEGSRANFVFHTMYVKLRVSNVYRCHSVCHTLYVTLCKSHSICHMHTLYLGGHTGVWAPPGGQFWQAGLTSTIMSLIMIQQLQNMICHIEIIELFAFWGTWRYSNRLVYR